MKKPRIVGLIQARMGSSRLPGKVMMKVLGKSMLAHQLERTLRAKTLDRVIVATSTLDRDAVVAEEAKAAGCGAFRGDEQDVLDRFYRAVVDLQPEAIVRMTADEPLMEPQVIDRVVSTYLEQPDRWDYVSNVLKPTYPDGIDIEVITFKALEACWKEAVLPSHREHVVGYVYHNCDFFGKKPWRAKNLEAPADFSHLRWTLDEPEDLEFMKRVFGELYPKNPAFTWMDVLALLTREPEIIGINHMHTRNAGLKKSLEADKLFLAGKVPPPR